MPFKTVNMQRRLLVAGLLTSCAYTYLNLPKAMAQPKVPSAMPATFVKVSQQLSGRESLNVAEAERLYAALAANNADFATQLGQLADFMAQKNPDPATLQAALDAEKAPFAKLPASILTAWYVGVVGSGKNAVCVTYETSLMAQAVADKLRPPSYAYGPYGSWSLPPAKALSV